MNDKRRLEFLDSVDTVCGECINSAEEVCEQCPVRTTVNYINVKQSQGRVADEKYCRDCVHFLVCTNLYCSGIDRDTVIINIDGEPCFYYDDTVKLKNPFEK